MSTSGQGDQAEISKDESEITSTTSENDGAPVSNMEIKTIEAVATDADSTVLVDSKESSETVNDDVETDSAIDSATVSNNDKSNTSGIQVAKTTPDKDNEVPTQCSNIEPEPCSSKTSEIDSSSVTEELVLKWDEDDIDEAVFDDDEKHQDIDNEYEKSTVDVRELIQNLDLIIESNDDGNKDLEDEANQSTKITEDKNEDEITSSIVKIDDVEMTSISFESQNIVDEIDNITAGDVDKNVDDLCLTEPSNPDDAKTPNLEMDVDTILTDELPKNVDSSEAVTPQLEEEMNVEIPESPLKPVEEAVSNEKDNKEKGEATDNENAVLKNQDTKEVSLVDVTKNTEELIESSEKDIEVKDLESKIDENVDKKEIISKDQELASLVETTDKNVKEIIKTYTKDVEIQNLDNKSNENEEKKDFDESNEDSKDIQTDTEMIKPLEANSESNQIDKSQKDTEINKPLEAITETDKYEKNDSKSTIKESEIDSNPIDDSIDKIDPNNESMADESIGTITPNIHHRINKPNVMLDIPTQELSDIEAELDDLDYDADKSINDKKVEKPQTIDSEMKELSDKTIDSTPTIDVISSIVNINTVSSSEELQSTLSTSKSTSPSKLEPTSTSKDIEGAAKVIDEITTQNVDNVVKDKNSTNLNVDKTMQIDVPSTSKSEGLEIPDDDVQEVSDSLGLLAESSRVMDDDNDDDDDGEDAEEADDNDDEDFDPYEETNSEMADDMDDSNTPPPELDTKPIKPGDKLLRDTENTMDIVDDIDCDENDLDLEIPDDTATDIQSNDASVNKKQPEIVNTDINKEDKNCPPDKIITILEKVLGSQMTGYKPKDTSLKGNVRNYVEVEGSSDSDDVQEVSKNLETACSTGSGSKLAAPKTQTKMPKINTDEVTIKTASASSTPSLHIPETTIAPKPSTKRDEIFNLDSDDEDAVNKVDKEKTTTTKKDIDEIKAPKEESPKTEKKCINPSCSSETQTYYLADRSTAAYYSLTRRSVLVCEPCRQRASERSEALIAGIKDLRPLLDLDMDAPSQQLVEISDSDSDGDGGDDTDCIGVEGAGFLEEHLADMINETWSKYEMESRLKSTETQLYDDLAKLEADAKEIDAMLDECQKKTDSIRFDFYKDYETRRKNVGAIVIHDTPFSSYSHVEKEVEQPVSETPASRYPKRRAASTANDTPAKKPAIPMGYTPLDADKATDQNEWKTDDDKEDISVVKLSAEAAPADLPPPGEIVRPPLKPGMAIYAMRNAFGTWLKAKIVELQPKAAGQQFSQCRVKFEHKVKNPCKVLAGRCLAYPEPSTVRMTIGTRVVALFKDPQNPTRRESFYSGVIAEIPNPVNNYRYLVFFDDGYAQYVHHQDTRVVCESSNLVWEEVHQFIREFIYNYLLSYPERPMVRLHAGEKLKTEWNGKWWDSKVLKVDASIALISFDEDNRTEWIYRGSTRLAPLYLELQAAKAGEGKGRSRLPRNKALIRSNMPCVEYTRSDEQAAARAAETQQNEEMRRQRAVAKKSTTQSITPTTAPGMNYEGVISRVVYYTPKNAVKPLKMVPHTCSVQCRRSDLLSMRDLRTYNPLAKPLLSGWERQTVRYKGHREVVYRAPCGRRLRCMSELHKYLRLLQSDMSVDLFDFTPGTHCLAEFVLSKCIVSKKDLSHGKENVPVPCVNYYDESLPEFCSYNTERTPTAGVPLNLDPDFLCGCDCTDDCVDKTKCACWKMTLEGARTIGLEGPNIGYAYRRLPEPLPSGIYECNSRCKCKQTCLNRVAQHPLQLKLQVFKTVNRGWGIRALNDVPKGSFLCVYAGNLLTDATANLDGLNEGDEYLAELDYIEVVEAMKEGYEDDVPDDDKKLDKKGTSASESEPSSESEDEQDHAKEDDDFQPGYIPHTNLEFKKSLRKREKAKKKEEQKQKEEASKVKKDDCITISDDEEVREPSRFTAEAGMADKDLIAKLSSRVSVRTLFGRDEACYIMDAKVQGNIGRYLNHSCHPNVFVQNVFVDTHDPRFPWVAFFALSYVRAGTELTWNYNYDVGSVPEKVLYCYCGAANCRGRLL